MRVIKFEGKSLDTLTPALSLAGRGGLHYTSLRGKGHSVTGFHVP